MPLVYPLSMYGERLRKGTHVGFREYEDSDEEGRVVWESNYGIITDIIYEGDTTYASIRREHSVPIVKKCSDLWRERSTNGLID